MHNLKWHKNVSTTFDHVENDGLWFDLTLGINVAFIKNDKLSLRI